MKLLEIRNNLAKLEYGENEHPALGKFITLTSETKSYVAQIINIKSDEINNFMVAKLMFTFTQDGIVDNYDGSIPNANAVVASLPSSELLDILPVESPIKIGSIAQEDLALEVDTSIFEHNFTVFTEHDFDKEVFISNTVRQLFWMKELSVIIDNANIFQDYKKLVLGVDYKLPLNTDMIDYILEYDLAESDLSTKAIIQDVFAAVTQYIKTLKQNFLPIDSFVDVVSSQYKESQMPELALLKNKLLKYKEANIFANEPEDFLVLNEKLQKRNAVIVDIKDINPKLQKKVIEYIHSVLTTFDKFVYFFVPLNDDNSDKKLVQTLINNNHVFSTILVSHAYKYTLDLKEHADNILLYAPTTTQHDFGKYNTFLNKLNLGEAVLYGKLTQGIPFVADILDMELDLTRDDVFGDRDEFVPAEENNTKQEPSTSPQEPVDLQALVTEKIQEKENSLPDFEPLPVYEAEENTNSAPTLESIGEEFGSVSQPLQNNDVFATDFNQIVEPIQGNENNDFQEITESYENTEEYENNNNDFQQIIEPNEDYEENENDNNDFSQMTESYENINTDENNDFEQTTESYESIEEGENLNNDFQQIDEDSQEQLIENENEPLAESFEDNEEENNDQNDFLYNMNPVEDNLEEIPVDEELSDDNLNTEEMNNVFDNNNSNFIEPVDNILSDTEEDEETQPELDNNIVDFGTIDQENSEVLTEDDLEFIQQNNTDDTEYTTDFSTLLGDNNPEEITDTDIDIYDSEDISSSESNDTNFNQGDRVTHPRYGNGIIEKIIKYGNKTLCSIDFENVGRRLLDPSVSEFEKI